MPDDHRQAYHKHARPLPQGVTFCRCGTSTRSRLKGLRGMRKEDRRAIQAYFWDELRGATLAKALGVSEDHAKKPVHRAIKHLQQALIMLAEEPYDSSF